MITQIQDVHERSTAGLRQSLNDLESLRTLLNSHEEKFPKLSGSPIMLWEHIDNTAMVERKLENQSNAFTNLESQIVRMKESVAKLCDDFELVTSQIDEQDSTLNLLDAKFDAMDFKVNAQKESSFLWKHMHLISYQAQLNTHGKLPRVKSCNVWLKGDHLRLNNKLKLIQSKVKTAHHYLSEEVKKSEHGLHMQIEASRVVCFSYLTGQMKTVLT
ncbi:hypothetical protein DFH28DRAFT_918485 [Melampsora americana]|nr:hypothetical protein DFH28DRAFT_918485 [Melampsora americana]